MTSEVEVADIRPLGPEDEARADFYALVSRLYAAAPDAPLLAAIAAAPPLAPADGAAEAAALASAWDALRAASGTVDPAQAGEEFQTLFIGVGRSEVSLYASHYLGPQSGRPLAEIRAALAALGLARRAASSEFEDHFSVLLETMRMLVAGNADRHPAPIAEQRAFCERHVMPWALDCCAAISQCPLANYYLKVASFTYCFLAIERDSFAID